jgi:hypothetical protein
MGRLLGQVIGRGIVALRSIPAQRIPSGIGGDRLAFASPLVQVGAALETESLAVLPAIHEGGHRKEPSFAYSWSNVELMSAGVVSEYVRIIFGSWIVSRREQEMCFLAHLPGNLGEAFPAVQLDCAGKASAEVKTAVTSAGKSSLDVHSVHGTRIGRNPDGVVGRKVTIDLGGRRLQGTDVEGQHSHSR